MMPGLFDDILNQDGGGQVLIDKSGRFDKLNPNFKNQIMGLANDFYAQYNTPLIITDTYRTQSEQAIAHMRKPTLALAAGPNARHPMGLAVDIDQNQAKMIDPQLLSNYGLGLPAINKGETWHIEPVVNQTSTIPNQQSGLFDDVLSQPKPQPGKVASIPEIVGPALQQAPTDPMAESMGMFQSPVSPAPETIMGIGTGAIPRVGIAAPITGLGLAATGAIRRATEGKQETYSPQDYALMEQGLPAVSQEMMKDLGIGMGAEVLTRGAFGLAGKMFGKLTDEARSVIDWARSKRIPYPADVAGGRLGKLAENLPDIGLGSAIPQLRRQKTAEKLTEAVQQVADDVGLPMKPTSEVGQDVANILHGMVSGSPEHTALKAAFKGMDQTQRYPVDSIKQTIISSFGQGPKGDLAEDIAMKRGLDAIDRVYGKNGPDVVDAIKEIVENNWTASPKNLDTLVNMVHLGIQKGGKNAYEKAALQAKGLADRLKQGVVQDMEQIMSPTGQTLGALLNARDTAYKEARQVISSINPSLNLLYQPGGSRRFAVTQYERNFEDMAEKLFRPSFEKQANELKDLLIGIGRQDVWDTAKMAFIKKGFDKSTFKKGDELFFSPTKYKSWFDENKNYLDKVMPDQMEGLQKWYNISNAFEADMKRFAQAKSRMGLGGSSTGLGALTSYFGFGGTMGFAVPQSISILSAMSIMPGLVRMYLPKPELTKAAAQAAKTGILEYEAKNE